MWVCKWEVKKCHRERLVNLLAFCLNLGEKAINLSPLYSPACHNNLGSWSRKATVQTQQLAVQLQSFHTPNAREQHVRHTLESPYPASSALPCCRDEREGMDPCWDLYRNGMEEPNKEVQSSGRKRNFRHRTNTRTCLKARPRHRGPSY